MNMAGNCPLMTYSEYEKGIDSKGMQTTMAYAKRRLNYSYMYYYVLCMCSFKSKGSVIRSSMLCHRMYYSKTL